MMIDIDALARYSDLYWHTPWWQNLTPLQRLHYASDATYRTATDNDICHARKANELYGDNDNEYPKT